MKRNALSRHHLCGFDRTKLTAFLRAEFPRDTAKSAASVLKTSPRNVENWLAHRATPGFLHLGAMIELWGARFLFETMLNPPPWVSEAARAEEYAALERRRDQIKSKYRTA